MCLAAPINWSFVLGRDTRTFLVLVGWHWSLQFFTVRSDGKSRVAGLCVGHSDVQYMMDVSHNGETLNTFVDDYRHMRSSNDSSLDKSLILISLSVVDLDTAIPPDVFGLWDLMTGSR